MYHSAWVYGVAVPDDVMLPENIPLPPSSFCGIDDARHPYEPDVVWPCRSAQVAEHVNSPPQIEPYDLFVPSPMDIDDRPPKLPVEDMEEDSDFDDNAILGDRSVR